MAIRPGSTESSGAVFACQSAQPAAATWSATTRTGTWRAATAGVSGTGIQPEWAGATRSSPTAAADQGYGCVAGVWSGHGIPVFQRASAVSTSATTAPGTLAAIARGSNATGAAPHECQSPIPIGHPGT